VTHVGHAAAFVWVDTLARVLRERGAEVIICRNVTDVDDVLLAAADRAGSPYDRFAAIQQFYFDRDMAALGVGQPALQPRAHAYIGQVISLAAGLLDRGTAYERDGQVYFRGADAARAAVPDRELALRLATEYGDDPADPAKDDPFDVAIWRASKSGEPGWASPAAATCVSRIMPTKRRWPKRSPGFRRFPAPSSTRVWSVWRERKWPSRRVTSSWSASCSRRARRRPCGC
jgi:L-cysteine:1D-myo-inositol 2-amino-2-deoxy-alpha-D-glucopyranoside ligase